MPKWRVCCSYCNNCFLSLCRCTLDANSLSPKSQIPSPTLKGYVTYAVCLCCAVCLQIEHFTNAKSTFWSKQIIFVTLSSDQWPVERSQRRRLWELQGLVQKQPHLPNKPGAARPPAGGAAWFQVRFTTENLLQQDFPLTFYVSVLWPWWH